MADVNVGQLATLAIKYYSPEMSDLVSDNVALLNRLKAKGQTKLISGGRELSFPLTYAENDTYTRYSGGQKLNIDPQVEFDSATYPWRQVAMAVTFTGLETDVQVTGKEALFDLVEERMSNMRRSLFNNMSTDVYSAGSLTNQINGLQALVADTPTSGTVGNIDRSSYSWWRNYSYDATTDGGAAAAASNIRSYMNTTYVNCSRGNDKPDLIVADNNYWLHYLESLQALQRMQVENSADSKLGTSGFQVLKYLNADVVLDGGYGGDCPTNHMYFLNTDHLKFCTARKRNFVPLNPDRHSVDQDATVKLMAWAGNLVLTNGFLQGVLKD